MNNGLLLLILIGLIILTIWIKTKTKIPKMSCMTLVSGGVKTGKTTLGVYLALKKHKQSLRAVKFHNFFARLFGKPTLELPLLYSNIPLNCDYVPVTNELLNRKARFVYGSTVYISEVSLVADSQLFKDKELNERLLYFNKLFGHESKGGYIIYDTQSISDCHYSIKRCLSEYFYIHHTIKWIPFFLLAYVEEQRYSEDGSTVHISDNDVETQLTKIIIPKKVWKMFDCYCYSKFTDSLPVVNNVVHGKNKSLKAVDVCSFRDTSILKENIKNE